MSLNVYTVQFLGCNLVYPITLSKAEILAKGERKVESQEERLVPLLEDLKAAGIKLQHVAADGPKRAELRYVTDI